MQYHSRVVLYSFYANLLMVIIVLLLSFQVISKQDTGLARLNILYEAYNDRNKRHLTCSEFKTYMEELDVEVTCGTY